jgi:hypothetical protein
MVLLCWSLCCHCCCLQLLLLLLLVVVLLAGGLHVHCSLCGICVVIKCFCIPCEV